MLTPGALAALPFFSGMPDRMLERLAATAEEKTLAPGDYVVRQHDEARYIFFLVSGSLQFLLRFEGIDELLVGTTRERGAVIGWSAFRPPFRYTASVRCDEPSRVVRLSRQLLDEVIAEDPHFGYILLRRVAAALADRLEQTRDLLVEPPWLTRRIREGLQTP